MPNRKKVRIMKKTKSTIWTVYLIFLVFVTSTRSSYSQSSVDSVNSSRLNAFLIATGVTYTAGLIALNQAWYADYQREKFHFFNDIQEWYQMDKLGHFYTGFYLSKTAAHAFKWTGLSDRKASIWGSVMGFALMIPIEIMDGYSSEYGASASDLMVNAFGAGFYLGQELLWNETRIHPKYSFSQSGTAEYRPELLGRNNSEKWLKDYNGQTYWLSFDLYSLINIKPKWLNIALGYGVENMVNANGSPTAEFPFKSYRQYYLAIDFDLTHIQSKSKVVNTIIYFVNMIHLPAPALEFNKFDKLVFHPIYF